MNVRSWIALGVGLVALGFSISAFAMAWVCLQQLGRI